MKKLFVNSLLLAGFLALAPAAQAAEPIRATDGIAFYVGIDGLNTLASGIFAGLANPNAGRLTLLFDHGDHFHSLGSYSYRGTAVAPVIAATNANNRSPEPYTRTTASKSAIGLMPGTGAFAGQWASGVLPAGAAAQEYSYLGVASIQSLQGVSTEASVLFNSSTGRWSGSHSNVAVGLKLEAISSGLKVAVGDSMDVFAAGPGTVFGLGSAGSALFMPTFYMDGMGIPGTYTAQFSLVNLGSNTAVGDGGTFFYDFATPVPEPGTWAMMLAGLAVAVNLARRRT